VSVSGFKRVPSPAAKIIACICFSFYAYKINAFISVNKGMTDLNQKEKGLRS
jgi:hypothetical protein